MFQRVLRSVPCEPQEPAGPIFPCDPCEPTNSFARHPLIPLMPSTPAGTRTTLISFTTLTTPTTLFSLADPSANRSLRPRRRAPVSANGIVKLCPRLPSGVSDELLHVAARHGGGRIDAVHDILQSSPGHVDPGIFKIHWQIIACVQTRPSACGSRRGFCFLGT